MSRGGENPWESNYSEDLKKGQESSDKSLADTAGELPGVQDKAKSFSFWEHETTVSQLENHWWPEWSSN